MTGCTAEQRKLILWGIGVLFGLTALFHYLYDWTGVFLFSFFSAVNESVWEHVKITFYAALFYGIFEYYRQFQGNWNFVFGKALGLIMIPLFIPFVYYGYTTFTGRNILWVDILTALLAGAVCQGFTLLAVCDGRDYARFKYLSLSAAAMLVLLFTLFTYYPPDFAIFVSP